MASPKILILDIETSPHMALVWKFWKENISPKQVLENGKMLSFAAKWLDGNEIFYQDISNQDEKSLLVKLFSLLDYADIVVCHNGDKFDLPHIQGRGLVLGLQPPSPYKTIDTLKVAKWEFNFPSNSLEYLANVLELTNKKGGHKDFPGFELWLGVLANNPAAWAEMKIYNIQDIKVLEELYLRFRPWMKRHPNVAIYEETTKPLCPKCGSDHMQSRGFAYTNVYKYRRFQCQSCGGWHRTRFNELKKENSHALFSNAG
jgi:DNA polymerase elongation subunit (family B)